ILDSLSSFFFSSRRRHTRFSRDWSSDVCSSDLDETGQRPAVALCDVTQQAQVDALVATALAELGAIDVLVNNAGLGGYAKLVDKIGRASCRERGGNWLRGGEVKKKRETAERGRS